MTLPWTGDRTPLDAETVRGLLTEQVAGVDAATARFLATGWDFEVWEADGPAGRVVARFPKTEADAGALDAEASFLPALAARTSVRVLVPCASGQPSARFPWRWNAYVKLEGTPLAALGPEQVDLAWLGERLGTFLGEVHGFPVERAAALGLRPAMRLPERMRARALERLAPVLATLGATAAEVVRARIEGEAPAALPERVAVPVHNDLHAEHLLVDEATGELAGVIDWSDLGLGDPATDFVGVYLWGGDALLDGTLAAYPREVDDGLRERARHGGDCLAVIQTGYGLATGNERAVRGGLRALERIARGR